MKAVTIILRTLLGLFLLMPVAGALGFFPAPTENMYTPAGWDFMSALMNSGYMMPLIGFTSFVSAVLFLIGQTAIAAIILTPFTVNVISFHLFLDATPVSVAAIPAYILLVLNIFFLWKGRSVYRNLWV